MKIAIRDDDVSFVTKPEELEDAYGEVWKAVPISLAIIPFVKGSQEKAFLPVGDNQALLVYLQDKLARGQLDIMLHGYSHEDYSDGYEFESGGDLSRKVKVGREYLETLFGKPVRVFVPPHNALSKTGIEAVEAMEMDILGSIPLKPTKRGLSLTTLSYIFRKKIYSLRNQRIGRLSYVYPYMMKFPKHNELGCFPLVPSILFNDLKIAFDVVSKRYDRFCLNTHYRELNSKKSLKEVLGQFVSYVSEDANNSFCPATELFDSEFC